MTDDHRKRLRQAMAEPTPYPDGAFAGRGIVICAGGERLFTCAWVLIRMLQDTLGCTLPIEVWHLGPREIGAPMAALLAERGVTLVDAEAVRRDHPVRQLGGWELKPYAILHSRFEEVLLIDADNVPVVDPAFLFDIPQYRETGAVFWPDIVKLVPDNPVWAACGLDYRDEPSFESGQVLVDKRRCWAALDLTMYFNAYSDFYYGLVHGDKDTFYLAWRLLDQPFDMPGPAKRLTATLCQHDFDGRRIFQHRNQAKWVLLGRNQPIEGFVHEDRCLEYLTDLRRLWDGRIFHPPDRSAAAKAAEAALVEERWFRCTFLSARTVPIEFLSGHRLRGRAPGGSAWHVADGADGFELVVNTDGRETERLRQDSDGVWRGRQLVRERVPVEIQPLSADERAAASHSEGAFAAVVDTAYEPV